MQPTMPPVLVKMQRVGESLSHWGPVLGRALGLYAPAVLGWVALIVTVEWLCFIRYTEPRDAELDSIGVMILQLWVVATIFGAIATGIIRKFWKLPAARSLWSVAGIAHAVLVRGPALLWMFFCLNAMATLHFPPPTLSAEQRTSLQIALAIWIAATALLLVIRGFWRLYLTRRARRQLAPAGEQEPSQ